MTGAVLSVLFKYFHPVGGKKNDFVQSSPMYLSEIKISSHTVQLLSPLSSSFSAFISYFWLLSMINQYAVLAPYNPIIQIDWELLSQELIVVVTI